ncbi:MFS transporter [Nonomuraea sp. NPDC052265]|uniref:MFS transporter n=1 Tax=Nonomuraea sp. NPDC052265 TaxID=3364374 RepID=UPI0037C5CEDF
MRGQRGLGAAVVAPATLTILTTTIPAGPARARAIATRGAVGAVGGAAGSFAGGLLTDYLSWRWILLINAPIGAVAITAALRLLAESRDVGTRGLDLTGAITVTVALSALELGMLQTPAYGWGSARALIPMGLGVLTMAAFVLVQARFARAPLMPLRIFRARSVSGALLVQFLLGAAGFAVWYFLSLYMQQVLHHSAPGGPGVPAAHPRHHRRLQGHAAAGRTVGPASAAGHRRADLGSGFRLAGHRHTTPAS